MSQKGFEVQAKYTFLGGNNDELRFDKNDVIIVTQRPDGGWWEGTLNGMTGWFPSNYVSEIIKEDTKQAVRPNDENATAKRKSSSEERNLFRTYIINDLQATEQAHVDELKKLFNVHFKNLREANM